METAWPFSSARSNMDLMTDGYCVIVIRAEEKMFVRTVGLL